jgi:hypothetical protein
MLECNPALKANELRAILMKTARDLGSPGRDDQFGAGEADAFAATEAAKNNAAVPVVTNDTQNPPLATVLTDKSTPTEPIRPAAQ